MSDVHLIPQRPATNILDEFRRNQGWSYVKLGAALGVAPWTAARYCRPLDDPDYRMPSASVAAKIPEITGDLVHVGMMLPLPERALRRQQLREAE